MYNKVTLLGRVACDLELKTTPSGKSVCSFTVACDRRYQQQGQERKADFLRCVAWQQTADFICRYWNKGKPIMLDGELQTRSYTDKNGAMQYITEIMVDRAAFTGDSSKPQNSAQASGNAPAQTAPPDKKATPVVPEQYTSADFAVTPTDDDYPF